MQEFCRSLASIEGSTVFEQATGTWKEEKEGIKLFRIILRPGRVDLENARDAIAQGVGELMVKIADTKFKQEVIMYTETHVEVVQAKNMRPIPKELMK